MKKLQEVKDYFKNAKEVRCLVDGNVYDLTKIKVIRDIHEFANDFWIDAEIRGNSIKLTDGNNFAEILSDKLEKYKITKEQLRSLTDPKVKEMFPEAFIEPTFEYLEEVEVSDSKDFLISKKVLYGCKNPNGWYICFEKENNNLIRSNYIRKIKQ